MRRYLQFKRKLLTIRWRRNKLEKKYRNNSNMELFSKDNTKYMYQLEYFTLEELAERFDYAYETALRYGIPVEQIDLSENEEIKTISDQIEIFATHLTKVLNDLRKERRERLRSFGAIVGIIGGSIGAVGGTISIVRFVHELILRTPPSQVS